MRKAPPESKARLLAAKRVRAVEQETGRPGPKPVRFFRVEEG